MAMRSDDWQSSRAAGVNPAQFAILALLEGCPEGMGVKEIAAGVLVSQPSATDSIAALERKGLVEKRPDPADLRALRILCTPAGLDLVQVERAGPAPPNAPLTPLNRTCRSRCCSRLSP